MTDSSTDKRKRSRSINLQRMRKAHPEFAMKPIALAVATAGLVGCGPNNREAYVYANVEECINAQPSYGEQCKAAYQQALEKSEREGNRYSRKEQCELEYGEGNCERRGSYFGPMMAAYMFSPLYHRAYAPLYTSTSRSSAYYGKWTTAGGDSYSKQTANNKVVLSKRTKSRGGFGSTTAAKSRWGGSSSRGGWGG